MGADGVLLPAFWAGDPLLVPEQRLGHRAGRDDERLGDECLEKQDEDDDEDDRLDDFASASLTDGSSFVLAFVAGLAIVGAG